MFSTVVNARFKSIVVYVQAGNPNPVGYYSKNGLMTTNREEAFVVGTDGDGSAPRAMNLAKLLLNGPHPFDHLGDLHVAVINVVR